MAHARATFFIELPPRFWLSRVKNIRDHTQISSCRGPAPNLSILDVQTLVRQELIAVRLSQERGQTLFSNPFFQSPDPRRSDASTSGTDSPRPGGSPPRSSPTGALDRRRHLIGVEAVQDARLLTQEDLDASVATPKPTYRSTLVRRPVMIVCPSSAPGINRTSSSIPRHMILLGQGFLFRGRNACAQTCVYDMMMGANGSDLGRRAP